MIQWLRQCPVWFERQSLRARDSERIIPPSISGRLRKTNCGVIFSELHPCSKWQWGRESGQFSGKGTHHSPRCPEEQASSCSAFQKTWPYRSWEKESHLWLVLCIPSYSLRPCLSWGTILSHKRWSVSGSVKSVSDYTSSDWKWIFIFHVTSKKYFFLE